jgi:hypothetical protein
MIFLSTKIIIVHQFSASAEREGLFAPARPPHYLLMIPFCSNYDFSFNKDHFCPSVQRICGERGIRTLDTVSRGIHALQACALVHSATSPSKNPSFFIKGENYEKNFNSKLLKSYFSP